jgi:hypothetical protein
VSVLISINEERLKTQPNHITILRHTTETLRGIVLKFLVAALDEGNPILRKNFSSEKIVFPSLLAPCDSRRDNPPVEERDRLTMLTFMVLNHEIQR